LTADDTAQRESRLLPTISAPSPNGLGAVFLYDLKNCLVMLDLIACFLQSKAKRKVLRKVTATSETAASIRPVEIVSKYS
jgi:hypothetical protein